MSTIAATPVPTPHRGHLWLAALVGLPFVGLLWLAGPGAWLAGSSLGTASAGFLLALLAICTVTDVSRRKIYNWATYPTFVWAIVVNALAWGVLPDGWGQRLGAVGLPMSLVGAAVGFGGVLVGYYLSGGGAGDVKLATALGAWLGPELILHVLVYTYVVAGLLVLAWSVWTTGPLTVLFVLMRRVGSLLLPGWIDPPSGEGARFLHQPVPLSPFFAAGTLAALLGLRL